MVWSNLFREEFVGPDLSLFVALLFKRLVDSPLVVRQYDESLGGASQRSARTHSPRDRKHRPDPFHSAIVNVD